MASDTGAGARHSCRAARLPGELPAPYLFVLYVQWVYIVPMTQTTTKSTRWNVRVAAEDDVIVREAASVVDRSLTEFVLDAAIAEAERVLADRRQFVLDDDRWNQFSALLDRPVRANEGLTRLFSRPSVFVEPPNEE